MRKAKKWLQKTANKIYSKKLFHETTYDFRSIKKIYIIISNWEVSSTSA